MSMKPLAAPNLKRLKKFTNIPTRTFSRSKTAHQGITIIKLYQIRFADRVPTY
jgi:hypothetical protein